MSKSVFEIEAIAEAAHEVWMEGKIRDGWTFAPITDKVAKQHACLIPYSGLSEADKDSNVLVLACVLLVAAGYEIINKHK